MREPVMAVAVWQAVPGVGGGCKSGREKEKVKLDLAGVGTGACFG
jgi:hypothetical protein